MIFSRLTAVALAFLAIVQASRAEKPLPSPEFTRESKVEMLITNFYESIPRGGFLPLRVDVKNDSDSTGRWEFRTTNNAQGTRSFQSVTKLEVPAKSARSFDVMVPLVPGGDIFFYSNLNIFVTGTGVVNGHSQDNSSSSGNGTPFLGMGEELATQYWSVIRGNFDKGRSMTLEGTSLEPTLMPEDWRAFAGFDAILLTDREWRSLRPAARSCVLDWTAQGGVLVLSQSGDPSGLPKEGSFGTGEVRYWSGNSEIPAQVEKLLTSGLRSATPMTQDDYLWSWSLAENVGRVSPPKILILGFVLIFAAVVGPLNFLVFAPVGRRHRLFWTTPLISLSATVLMFLFIALSEGFGGRGERFMALLNLPDEHKSILWQEQVSRTGVLVSGTFNLPASTLPVPIGLLRTASSRPRGIFDGGNLFMQGDTFGGDWFKSRSTQAQLLMQVAPSRNRLEVTTDAAGVPTVTSSFEQDLGPLWYFDSASQPWRGDQVGPGQSLVLSRANPADFETWLTQTEEPAGPVIRNSLRKFQKAEGSRFFATVSIPPAIGSLSAISWKNDRGVIMGKTVSR